jgi:hypothetical protein
VTKKQIEVKQPDLTMLVTELIDEMCVTNMLLEEIRHLTASSFLTQARIYDRVAFHPDAQTYKEAEDIVTDSYRRIKTVEDDQDETCGAAEDAKADDNGGVAA